jgi:hypothetical protein
MPTAARTATEKRLVPIARPSTTTQRMKLVSRVSLSTLRKRTTPKTARSPKTTIKLPDIAAMSMATMIGRTARAPTKVRE